MLEGDRVIPCAIPRNPADIAYINPASVLTFPCPISAPRNHQTHIKTIFFPYRAHALIIVAKKQNRMTANAISINNVDEGLVGFTGGGE